MTSEGPLVVVLDDLHWADRPSLDLLEYVSRSISVAPLLVLGTHRDVEIELTHPLAQCLAAIHRQASLRVQQLGRLTDEALGTLISALAGSPIAPELVTVIAGETAGNPFFAEEIVRQLVEEGRNLARPSSAAGWGIPTTVKQAVGARLARLSDEANRALSVAARPSHQRDRA